MDNTYSAHVEMAAELISPATHFGFMPGTDRQLFTWASALKFYRKIAVASDRVVYSEIGRSTEGLPFVALTISAPENLVSIGELQAVQARLADPRGLGDDEANVLIEKGRAVVLINCGIHPAEVGSSQMAPLLVHELATRNDATFREIRENVVLVLIPSANPDGMDLVTQWCDRTKGTPAEGTWPPQISHKYVGGENNRDWFTQTQIENRLVVDHVLNKWFPHIDLDMHQQEPDGPRLVVPPYIEPVDPDIDPTLNAFTNEVGASIMLDLTAAGLRGVASRTIYQAYSPHLSYSQHHGAVRILTEAASCEIATPISIPSSSLRIMGNLNPAKAGLDNPAPWPGGRWGLDDIVAYDKAAALSVLSFAARRRRALLANILQVQRRSVKRSQPFAFIIPGDQPDPERIAELVEILRRGLVEVERIETPLTANRTTYSVGSFVIRLAQPFGNYAKTLLERRPYPAATLYPGGPPKAPYDVATHCFPLCFGVRVDAVATPFVAKSQPVRQRLPLAGRVRGEGDGFLLRANVNYSYCAATAFLKDGGRVSRFGTPVLDGTYPAGTFVLHGLTVSGAERVAATTGADVVALGTAGVPLLWQVMPRIALYKPHMTGFTVCDEGWLRFVLEQYGFPITTIHNADVRGGELARNFDVVILASQVAKDLICGQDPREFPGVVPSNRDMPDAEEDLSHLRLSYPHPYAGGIGELGARRLATFVEQGGVLIAIDASSQVALRYLLVSVSDALAGIGRDDFNCPGSLLRLGVDTTQPIGWGLEHEVAAMCLNSPAFRVDPGATVVARHVAANSLLAGWVKGAERLAGLAALVEAPLGRGRVILFGFRPHFRAQMRGTYRFLFNAILSAGLERPAASTTE
jgi:hypothetical protein